MTEIYVELPQCSVMMPAGSQQPSTLATSRNRCVDGIASYVLGAAEGDTGDARDVLQAELGNGLAGLLLVARVDGDSSTAGDDGLLASLRLRVALDGLGDLLIRELFNTGVGHCERVKGSIERRNSRNQQVSSAYDS